MILLIGVSIRALMESAIETGQDVRGLDFFGDWDTRQLGNAMDLVNDFGLKPSVKVLLEAARSISCEGLVYGSGPENHPEGLAYWEEQGLLYGNGVSDLTKVRNPWLVRQCLEQTGVRMPEFFSLKQWKPNLNGKKWLLKPLHRGGGHGIVELPDKNEAASALLSGLKDADRYIIEEYIEGIPASVTFLANGREAELLGTSRQLIGNESQAKPFLYMGNIVPFDFPSYLDRQILIKELMGAISHLTAAFRLRGVNTLDFMVNPRGIFVLELNPRWSGSVELIENYLGERIFERHLSACRGLAFDSGKEVQDTRPGYWGKTLVYADFPFTVKKHENKELRFLYENGVRDIPRAGTRIDKGQPICTVLTKAGSDKECYLSLQAKADWVIKLLGQKDKIFAGRQIIS